jgi:hypothetical protein
MDSAANQRGFSALEVCIAALLTVGLLGVAFSLVNRNQAIYTSETNMTDLNQNVRVSMDLLTRDIQTAGMGLPGPSGSMAAIYYVDGANDTPDALLLLNGDAFAPTVDVDSESGTSFTCVFTGDITVTGSGSSAQFSYQGPGGSALPLFQTFVTTPRYYVVYDNLRSRVMELTADGELDGSGKVVLTYNGSNYRNPGALFSTALGGATVLDTDPPDYPASKVAMLGSMVGYRVNTTTGELLRSEDMTNWYAVARGITDLQVRYRCISRDGSGNVVETVEAAPTNRGTVRAVEVRLAAETADLPPTAKAYRQVVQTFEVSPRNFNLLNNTNLSSDVD